MKTTRTNRLLPVLAFAISLLQVGAAAAHGTAATSSGDDGWVPVRHLEFTPDDVEGGLSGPEGEPIVAVPRAEQPSLIEIRRGFEAETVKTMENM